MNKTTDDDLQIKIGDKLKYYGSPGAVKGRLAVQISEIVSEGVDENEQQ